VKLASGRVQSFLASYRGAPDPKMRAFLVYGPDGGLVRETAESLAKAVVPDLDDPFRVSNIGGPALAQDPARLHDEMAAIALGGGRRLVRVREAGDKLGAVFAALLKDPPPGDSVCVVEAGELPARSSLRRAFEAAGAAAALPCQLDDREALEALVKTVLGAHRIEASPEARDYIVGHLGADRGVSRAELEKLALYAGDGGRVEFEDAVACIGDSAVLTVEDVVFAAAEGDSGGVERALARAFQEGETAVAILHAAAGHFERLHRVGAKMGAGASVEEAMRSLWPPVFFKREGRFKSGLGFWTQRRAALVLEMLQEAERNCKRTGFPDASICSDALLRVARFFRANAGRR